MTNKANPKQFTEINLFGWKVWVMICAADTLFWSQFSVRETCTVVREDHLFSFTRAFWRRYGSYVWVFTAGRIRVYALKWRGHAND